MIQDELLREQLVSFLRGGQAFMPFEDAVKDFPEEHYNDVFPKGTYTFWHLLEHIRRAQADILNFIKNPDYKELRWPEDYWPVKVTKATNKEWERTIGEYERDVRELEKIVMDKKTDLYRKIPWGSGQIFVREIMLTANHSAYHIGEFAIMRQVFGTWGEREG